MNRLYMFLSEIWSLFTLASYFDTYYYFLIIRNLKKI
jgi:hypothetical protein